MSNRIDIDQITARRYILAHQGLLPPRSLEGPSGLLSFMDRVSCIQFDPLDVVGRNPDLVLQSRIRRYSEDLLYDQLYKTRSLLDCWDKLMSIVQVSDWPYFRRRREDFRSSETAYAEAFEHHMPAVLAEVERRGPVSTADIGIDEKVDWHWGPTRAAKAALELMWNRGDLIIERKERVRRIYDLTSRHLPSDLLAAGEPIEDDERYRDWYVKRRIGSVGMLPKRAGDEWHGVWRTKTPERRASIERLHDTGSVTEVVIDGKPFPYYVRSEDLPAMEAACEMAAPMASVVAPLDNLMWGRKNIVENLFDFNYRWEVYKPASERQFGYYVLPVLYGDRFIARFEPSKRGGKTLGIVNWWWEDGVKPDADMKGALVDCFSDFLGFVGAEKLERQGGTTGDRSLAWTTKVRRAY